MGTDTTERRTQWWWQLLCAKGCDKSASHIVPLAFLKPHEVLQFPPFFDMEMETY